MFRHHQFAATLPIRLVFDYFSAACLAAYVTGALGFGKHSRMLFGVLGALFIFFESQKRLGELNDSRNELFTAGVPPNTIAKAAVRSTPTELLASSLELAWFILGCYIPAVTANTATFPILRAIHFAFTAPIISVLAAIAGAFFVAVTALDAVLYGLATIGWVGGTAVGMRRKLRSRAG